jgi:hypothetical protein
LDSSNLDQDSTRSAAIGLHRTRKVSSATTAGVWHSWNTFRVHGINTQEREWFVRFLTLILIFLRTKMFHVYWPAVTALTMIVFLGVIVIMLKYGPRLCKTRHTAKPNEFDWQDKTYEQKVSYAWLLCAHSLMKDASLFRNLHGVKEECTDKNFTLDTIVEGVILLSCSTFWYRCSLFELVSHLNTS